MKIPWMEKKGARGCPDVWLLVFLYAATRILLMFCSEMRATHAEVLFMGSVSQGILQGWAVPFWDFQHTPYSGGYLVNGLLGVPFFFLFGARVVSLYLLAICMSLAGLVLIYYLCRRYYGRRTAVFAALLYTFAPPLLTGFSVVCDGDLRESAILGPALFFLFLNAMRSPSGRNYLLLGLASGFALWYSYINLVTVCGYTVLWFLRDRVFFLKKNYWIYGAGAAAGFAPWFMYNAHNGYAGLGILAANGFSLSGVPVKFLDLVFNGWQRMFIFNQFSAFMGAWFNAAYYWIFLLSAAYLILQGLCRKGAREWELLIFPAVFAVLYSMSSKQFENSGWDFSDYRYAAVMMPFVLLTVAAAASRAWEDRQVWVKACGGVCIAAAVFMGIAGNRGYIVSTDFKNNYLYVSGYYYYLAGEVAFRKYGLDLAMAERVLDRVPSGSGRAEAYLAYGKMIGNSGGLDRREQAFKTGGTIGVAQEKRLFYWGWGEGVIEHYYSPGYEKQLSAVYAAIAPWPQEERLYAACGMLTLILHHTALEMDVSYVLAAFPPEFRRLTMFLYGRGKGINYFLKQSDSGLRQNMNDADFRAGFASGVLEFFNGDMDKTMRYCKKFGIHEDTAARARGLYLFDPKSSGRDPEALKAVMAMTGYGGGDAGKE